MFQTTWKLCLAFWTVLLCISIGLADAAKAGALIGPLRDQFDRELGSLPPNPRNNPPVFNYEFFRPPNYAAAEELPLVVFLHGSTDGMPSKQARLHETMGNLVHATQRDNAFRETTCSADPGKCAAYDDDYAAFLLMPKIPINDSWTPYLDQVDDWIEDLTSRYNVDTDRIYLTGYSLGGFASLDIVERYPDRYAAAISISGGGFPSLDTVDAVKHVPWWFFHGAGDATVSPSLSSDFAAALVDAEGEANLTLVPGGHNAGYEYAFRDANDELYPWLFSKSLAVPEPGAWLLALITVVVLPSTRYFRA